MRKNAVAIITARGGSKRIPRKNIKEFCGKPIITYSIEAALKSGIFDEIMVSTDDEEIAETAQKAGAAVPFMRSEKTSNDYATTSDVLLEVFSQYKDMDIEFNYACCLYPTAPFITPEKLKTAFKTLINENASAVIPVVRFSYPPQRGYIIDNGRLKYKYPENYAARSQDLEPIYHDSGQFYFYNTDKFIKSRGIFKSEIVPIILSDLEVQDIDDEKDWKMAEIKYKNLTEINQK